MDAHNLPIIYKNGCVSIAPQRRSDMRHRTFVFVRSHFPPGRLNIRVAEMNTLHVVCERDGFVGKILSASLRWYQANRPTFTSGIPSGETCLKKNKELFSMGHGKTFRTISSGIRKNLGMKLYNRFEILIYSAFSPEHRDQVRVLHMALNLPEKTSIIKKSPIASSPPPPFIWNCWLKKAFYHCISSPKHSPSKI